MMNNLPVWAPVSPGNPVIRQDWLQHTFEQSLTNQALQNLDEVKRHLGIFITVAYLKFPGALRAAEARLNTRIVKQRTK